MKLRALSLCSGIGGLDLGLEPWCEPALFCEIEPFCRDILSQHFPGVPIHDDLRTLDGRAWRGRVDIVVGGYPCQPFSQAGKRLGADDHRHLWPEIRRILEQSGAPLAFFENVRGHLSLGFADVLGDLARLGFDAEWTVLGADDVGAPHRRDRLFILAYRQEFDRRLQLLGRGPDEADSEPGGRGEAVADADGAEWRPPQSSGNIGHGRSARRPEEAGRPSGDRSEVGDAGRLRDGRSQPIGLAGSLAPPAAWPPGPADGDGWRTWIAEGGPQPILRRGVDGSPAFVDRAKRLKALGNAVVPAQARLAFGHLLARARRA